MSELLCKTSKIIESGLAVQVSIDTACSSALVGAHAAAQHLGRHGGAAVSAGVNMMLAEQTTAATHIAGPCRMHQYALRATLFLTCMRTAWGCQGGPLTHRTDADAMAKKFPNIKLINISQACTGNAPCDQDAVCTVQNTGSGCTSNLAPV